MVQDELALLALDDSVPNSLIPVPPAPDPMEVYAMRSVESRASLVGIEAPHLAVLTLEQVDFVTTIVRQRLSAPQAAAMLGLSDDKLMSFLNNSHVRRALRIEQHNFEDCVDITRRDVVDGLLTAIMVAQTTGDASSMVSGWREVAAVTGVKAPVKVQVDATVTGKVDLVHRMERMTDAELLRIASSEVIEGEVIE